MEPDLSLAFRLAPLTLDPSEHRQPWQIRVFWRRDSADPPPLEAIMAVLAGFAKWRAALGVGLRESSRRALIKRAVVFLELERVMAALGADRLGHFRVAMQCVGGGDAAFQIKAFQGFEGRFDLVGNCQAPPSFCAKIGADSL